MNWLRNCKFAPHVTLLALAISVPAHAQFEVAADLVDSYARTGSSRKPAAKQKAAAPHLATKEISSLAEQPRPGLFSLPEPAQPAVSATLGQEDARYQVRRAGGTLAADNPAQSLSAEFTSRGTELRAGRIHWRMALAGYGYGRALKKAPAAAPQSRANRVEYLRGPLTEWYVNGPLGLEQSFTLAEPPVRHSSQDQDKGEPLTIALTLGGDLSASADPPAQGPGNTGAEGVTLRDRNGQPVLRYTGLAAYDANGQKLRAWLELEREQLRLRVEDAQARYPVVVDPFVQRSKLTSSDGAANDDFGVSVAISSDGSTIVVGAAGVTIGSNALQGAAYIFVKPSTGWPAMATEVTKLTSSDGGVGDEFGVPVSVSGDGSTIVAGSGGNTVGGNTAQGAAYVFVKPSTGWPTTSTETGKLIASDGLAHDVFGTSVGISSDGSTIVAGALGAARSSYHAAAYLFLKPPTGWTSSTEAARLTASDGTLNDNFGVSAAINSDGSTIVVGAPATFLPGSAYVFVKPAAGWLTATETAKLTASDGVVFDNFGGSTGISADGSTIVTGAHLAQIGSTFHQGAVYVFVEPASGWASGTEAAKLIASDGAPSDQLGSSVGISGDGSTIESGAVRATVGSNLLQGAAYLFVKPSTGWTSGTETAKLTATDGGANDIFGNSVSLSGDASTIVTSAFHATIGSNSDQGAVYVFLAAPSANASPTNLSFGNQAVGTASSPQLVSLLNNGNAPLHVTGVAATSGFSTTTNCVTASPLAVGASCTESATFTPTTTGALAGNLTFTDDSGGVIDSTQTLSLSGTGVKATTTTSIVSVVPNPSVVGQPVTVNFSVAPQAGDILAPSGNVPVSASTTESCTGSAPSGSCALTFLTPVARTIIASYGGDANFLGSNSAGVTQTVQDFTLAAGPASQTISSGHSANYTLSLTALDGLSGAVSLGCSGGPPGSTCIFTLNPLSIGGSANATLSLSGPGKMNHGTFTLTFTGTFGSGDPATGGLTRTASASMTVK